MKILVTVKTGAKQEQIVSVDATHYRVAVQEHPIRGKANQAVIRALADYLDVPASSVKIISGFTARQKTLEIKAS